MNAQKIKYHSEKENEWKGYCRKRKVKKKGECADRRKKGKISKDSLF